MLQCQRSKRSLFQRTITAPFWATVVWSTRVLIKEELIEDYMDSAATKPLSKSADALSLLVIGLPIADEYLGHEGSLDRITGFQD
jgi:hypothetical protein